jgi:glycosyltransferase involved in cell wall biosynthesis
MKCIFFICLFDEGFISHRLNYAKSLIKKGNKVYLFTISSKYKKKLIKYGIELYKLPLKKRYDFNILNFFYLIKYLNNKVKKLRPDIYCNVGIYPTLIGIFLNKKKIKVINCINGLGSVSIIKNIKNIFFLKIIKIVCKIFLRKDIFLVQNRHDYFFFKSLHIKKIYIVHGCGILLNKKKIKKKNNKVVKIIFHSRLLKVKGILDLYEAALIIKNKFKNLKCKFEIYGNLDLNNPDSLTKFDILKMQINKYFKFKGSNLKIRNRLNYYDICCIPSYREGFSRSLLEAAASGLPIISTRAPGNVEIIKNNFNGLLVKINDPIALSNAICKLVSNKKKRVEMGQNSIKIVKQKFINNIIFKKLDEIFL